MTILDKSEEIQELFNQLRQKNTDRLYIYGARNTARRLYLELEWQGLAQAVQGFLVSSAENNPSRIGDKPVLTPADVADTAAEVIITAEKRHLPEIVQSLTAQGFTRIYYPEEGALKPLYQASSKEIVERLSQGKYRLQPCESDTTYMKLDKNSDKELDKKEPYYMVSPYFGIPYDEATAELFQSYDFEAEYKRIFGAYRPVASIAESESDRDGDGEGCMLHTANNSLYGRNAEIDNADISIYMVTSHSNQMCWNKQSSAHLIPIQAGAALTTQQHCELRDNAGDHISERNLTLGEMTATYWVWKNAPHAKYKGICHYRRHFQISEAEYRAILAEGTDAILCTPRFVLPGNVDNLIRMNLVEEEAVTILLEIVRRCAPQYYACTEAHLKQNMFYPCNMLIAREEVFNSYCEFMFSILTELDDGINARGLKTKARCAAYLAELLTSVYFVYHKDRLRLAIADYQLME